MFNNTTPACPDPKTDESIIGSLSALGAGIVGFVTSFLITNREAIGKWMMSKLGKTKSNNEDDQKNQNPVDVIVDNGKDEEKPIKIRVRSRASSIDGERKSDISIEISDEAPKRGRKKTKENKTVKFRHKSAPPLNRSKATQFEDGYRGEFRKSENKKDEEKQKKKDKKIKR